VNLGLNGTRALVGGGSRGLGAAIVESLSAEGGTVAVAARESDSLLAIADRCSAAAVPVDLHRPEGAGDAVDRAVAELGGLDLLVVNSGGPPAAEFAAAGESEWRDALQGTLLSAVRLIRSAVPHLRRSDRAAILVVLSSSVRIPIEGLVTSNVLRPGLVGLIKTLAGELAPGIRINGVAPGRIATQRSAALDRLQAERSGMSFESVQGTNAAAIPLARYGRPQEFANVAAFLLSPAASYVSGQILPVDGAMTRTLP
jgi:3-oxoacyl-[acyl-carrier protein] reductase